MWVVDEKIVLRCSMLFAPILHAYHLPGSNEAYYLPTDAGRGKISIDKLPEGRFYLSERC